jgi:phosphatidylglycerol---prolipoprotein diacylglyceryl transferase
MLPVLNVGPLALQTPGLILLLGLWLGLTAAEKQAARTGFDTNRLYNLVFAALIAGVAGGRLFYAARYSDAFISSPGSLLSLNPGLFDAAGGLAAAVIAGLIYMNRARLPGWRTLDVLTPLFAVLGIAIALANLASGAGFGAPTNLPWAIELWSANRHPSQIYDALAALVIFIVIIHPRTAGWLQRPGVRFLSFAALSAAARLFLEAFRGDSVLVSNGIRSAQLAAWLVLAVAIWALYRQMAEPAEEGAPSAMVKAGNDAAQEAAQEAAEEAVQEAAEEAAQDSVEEALQEAAPAAPETSDSRLEEGDTIPVDDG